MRVEIKFKSITVRWFINVFLIVAVVVSTMAIVASISYSNVFIERIETKASEYASDFSVLSNATAATYSDAAVQAVSDFEHKTKIEVQVLDKAGDVMFSTTGFQPVYDKGNDYERAVKSSDGIGIYKGKNTAGERVLSSTVLIYDKAGGHIGAYRWITSLEDANRKITTTILIILLVCSGVLAFYAVSGLYFVRSIVKPIRDVSNTARKIAMGDFESQINIKNNDEIGELCDTINYMASELSRAENVKNEFISSVSHELRTPLTAIRGWGETVKMSITGEDELVSRGLEVILSEADRLSGLVEDLLDFSRIESGRLSVEMQPVDATKLLCESAGMYMEISRQQGIDLVFTEPKVDATVMGDVNRLKQVFINIIDNAVKYTEKGGQVLIEQNFEEGCVRINVTDTGVGIPAQDIDRIKEKFYKANKTVRGSGIGLAVADEIIKQHQGLLFIESTEGVGTSATIVLPLCEESPELKDDPGALKSESDEPQISLEEIREQASEDKTEIQADQEITE